VRHAEGWGSSEASYYRALPYVSSSDPFASVWRIRAASFHALLRELPRGKRLRVLDLGAGNCWLANQLALRGHDVAAVDLQVDALDGLGAARHYGVAFTLVQAEFDRLPLASSQADLVVFNGSLHYSTDLHRTLQEVLRVLAPGGTIAILDSPMYPTAASGKQMVAERASRFQRQYGFTSDALASEHFLTPARLAELGASLGIRWRTIRPWHGWRRALLPYWARLRGARQPAQFPLLLGSTV
jgi:SAM-dependent methyltransferase